MQTVRSLTFSSREMLLQTYGFFMIDSIGCRLTPFAAKWHAIKGVNNFLLRLCHFTGCQNISLPGRRTSHLGYFIMLGSQSAHWVCTKITPLAVCQLCYIMTSVTVTQARHPLLPSLTCTCVFFPVNFLLSNFRSCLRHGYIKGIGQHFWGTPWFAS